MKILKVILLSFFLISNLTLPVYAQQNRPIRTERLSNFKGLDSKTSPYDLPKEFADIVENVRFTKIGSIKTRDSRAKYNATELVGSSGLTYLERIYANSPGCLIVAHGEHLLVGHDTLGTFSGLLSTAITSGLRWMGVTFKNWHYLGNGTDSNVRTDGLMTLHEDEGGEAENTRTMGCPVPATTLTCADSGTAGNPDGTYTYKVTYLYDDYQESNGSSASNSVTVTTNKISLTSIPTSSDDAVTDRKIYRTEDGGSVYKLVTTISDKTTTTYTDNTADASLGANIPTDHDIPPACKYFRLHKERIFMAGGPNKSRLYFTDIVGITSYPDIVPTLNYLDIAADDGDEITGIAIDPMGLLCVFKKNTIRKVFTEGKPTAWTISDPFSSKGCIAPYSISESPEGIFYLARSGERGKEIRIFDGQNSKLISERVEPTLNEIPTLYVENTTGIYHRNRYYLAFNSPEVSDVSYNNALLIIDLLRDAFSIDTGKNINRFSHWYGGDDIGELYTADSNEGYVYREDTTMYDVIHDLKSELDEGTYIQMESTGTEANPEVHLVASDLTDDFGATNYEDLTTTNYEDYTGDLDTYYPSGSLISDVLRVNAKNLSTLYWVESLGLGDCQFWVRTGNTISGCEASSWNGPYTTPTGSDISSVTAEKYFQYKVKLYTYDPTVVTTPKLYLSGSYVIKVYLGAGDVAETTWALNYRIGDLHLGSPFLRKHLIQIRIKHEGTEGTLYIYYRFDEGSESSFLIDLATDSTSWKKNFPYNAFGETIRLRIYYDDNADFELKEVTLVFSDEPLEY